MGGVYRDVRVLILIIVVGCISHSVSGAIDSLSGTWEFATEVNLTTGKIAPSMELAMDSSIGLLDVTLESTLTTGGVDELIAESSIPLGIFDFTSKIELRGDQPFFRGARFSMSWPVDTTSWSLALDLPTSSSRATLGIIGAGRLPEGRWDLEILLDECISCFRHMEFGIRDLAWSCLEDVDFSVEFSSAGFEIASVSFGDIPFPFSDLFSLAGMISYKTFEKSFDTRLAISPIGEDSCFGILLQIVGDGRRIDGLEVRSLDLRFEPAGLDFAWVHTAFWDAITLSGASGEACRITWTAQIYMKDSSEYLFDISSASLNVNGTLSSRLCFGARTHIAMDGDIELEFSLGGGW